MRLRSEFHHIVRNGRKRQSYKSQHFADVSDCITNQSAATLRMKKRLNETLITDYDYAQHV